MHFEGRSNSYFDKLGRIRGSRGSRSNDQSRQPRTPADRLSILKATAFFALGIVFVRSSLGGALVPVF